MDPFSQGLFETLKPAVVECDQSIRDVMAVQEKLSLQVETMYNALEKFKSEARLPAIERQTAKLQQTRARLGRH